MVQKPFKICPCCNHVWEEREEFLSDLELFLNGYQADLDSLEEGLLFFTHEHQNCHSTLSIQVQEFLDLYQGPRYTERLTFTEDCPRYCLDQGNLDRCSAHCECAVVRELLQIINKRKEVQV